MAKRDNMEKYYQNYLAEAAPKPVYLRFSSLIIIASGLLLAIIFMTLINNESDDIPNYEQALSLADQPENLTNTNDIVETAESSTERTTQTTNSNEASDAEPAWQTIPIANGDTLINLLAQNNINSNDAIAVLSLPEVKKNLTRLQIGENLQLKLNEDNELLALTYPLKGNETLVIEKNDTGFAATIKKIPVKIREQVVSATINDSLYDSAKKSGLSTKTIMQLIQIFRGKISFAHDIHPGDSFQLVYENKYTTDDDQTPGDILAAKFEVGDKTYTAVRFKDHLGHVGYYSPDGKSLKAKPQHTFSSPVHYTRISSPFNLHRMHPILHFTRPHQGVDLAAPRGTQVKAAGEGTVVFVGRNGGYGNFVKINHGHGVTTGYAHLSKFAKGIHVGSHVSEGQLLAYVGSTGLASGPHLHFEVRQNGVPKNPLSIALPYNEPVLAKNDKLKFKHQSATLLAELSHADAPVQYALNTTKTPVQQQA